MNTTINWKSLNTLNRDEQIEAARQAQAGDTTARDCLVQANMKLAAKSARQHSRSQDQYAELLSAAFVGLCEAVDLFDPDRGIAFTTYASWHINNRVKKEIIESASIVRFSTRTDNRKAFWNMARTRARLEAQGKDASQEAIAKELNVSPEAVNDIKTVMAGSVSMQAPTNIEGSSTFGDTLAASDNPAQEVEHDQAVSWLHDMSDRFADNLKDKEHAIWTRRVWGEENLQEIADDLGCSKQYVGRLEATLRDRFKRYCLTRAK